MAGFNVRQFDNIKKSFDFLEDHSKITHKVIIICAKQTENVVLDILD